MNQPFFPHFPPDPMEQIRQIEKRQLRRDATYIGVLSITLTLVMEFAFTILVIFLLQMGIFNYEQLSDPFLGLGNTAYMWLYIGVYTFSMLVPAVVVSLCFKKRFMPFSPAKPVPFGVAFFGIIGAIGLCMLTNIVNSYVLAFFSDIGLSIPEVPQTMVNTPASFALNLFTMAVLPALLEELIYRGYILRTLRPYGNWFAVIVSATLFSLMHGNLRQIPFAFIIGLVLGLLYVVTDNIWIPVAVHFTNNAISVLMEYLGFALPDKYVDVFYTLVIDGLVFVGLIAVIVLFSLHKAHINVPKSGTALSVRKRTATLLATPLFLLSVILYLLLLYMGS